nr:STAS domain-containing protein [Kibdelosporangium sp. MJ126-NF4]CEL13765.1 Anti-sigma F factor antagonist (spoIIAA-2); Anti-sigma B factor antagonist RsbV [Kibdelosporangium sp. MJ126-NF4]
MSSAEFQPLSIEVGQGPSGPVLAVRGEIDTVTAPQLQAGVRQALPGAGRALVVDLSGVTFLSSAGLSVLVQAHQQAGEAGCELRIVTNSNTARVFALTGLTETLRLFDSADTAREV